MPRGKPGTGPNARKRVQRDLAMKGDVYVSLQMNHEETKLVYEILRSHPRAKLGTREGAVVNNVLYRMTEAVMSKD